MSGFLARHRARFTARITETRRQALDWQQHCDDALHLFDFNDTASEPLPPAVDVCSNPECQLCHPEVLTARDIIEAWRVGIDLR